MVEMTKDQLQILMEQGVEEQNIRAFMDKNEKEIDEIIRYVKEKQGSKAFQKIMNFLSNESYFHIVRHQKELIQILSTMSEEEEMTKEILNTLVEIKNKTCLTKEQILVLINRIKDAKDEMTRRAIGILMTERYDTSNLSFQDCLDIADVLDKAETVEQLDAMLTIALDADVSSYEISDIIPLLDTILEASFSNEMDFERDNLLDSMAEIATNQDVLENSSTEEIGLLMKELEHAKTKHELDSMTSIATSCDVMEYRNVEEQLKLMEKISEEKHDILGDEGDELPEDMGYIATSSSILANTSIDVQLNLMDTLKLAETDEQLEGMYRVVTTINLSEIKGGRVVALMKELTTTKEEYQINYMEDIAYDDTTLYRITTEEQLELMDKIRDAKTELQAKYMAKIAIEDLCFYKNPEDNVRIISHSDQLELMQLVTSLEDNQIEAFYDCALSIMEKRKEAMEAYWKMAELLHHADSDDKVMKISSILRDDDVWCNRDIEEIESMVKKLYDVESGTKQHYMSNLICSKTILENRTAEEQETLLSILSKIKEDKKNNLGNLVFFMEQHASTPMEDHLVDVCLELERLNEKKEDAPLQEKTSPISAPAKEAPLESILSYLDFVGRDSFDGNTVVPVKMKKYRENSKK